MARIMTVLDQKPEPSATDSCGGKAASCAHAPNEMVQEDMIIPGSAHGHFKHYWNFESIIKMAMQETVPVGHMHA